MSAAFLSTGPLLDSARANSSTAVTFRFAMMVEKAAVGKARRGGKERDRTRDDQTGKVEGW
jgi:hypothetical protein